MTDSTSLPAAPGEMLRLQSILGPLAQEGLVEDDAMPSLEPLRGLVRWMRAASRREGADPALARLLDRLEGDAHLARGVRAYMTRLSLTMRTNGTLADFGLLPSHGFLAELRERVVAKVLPSHRPPHDLAEILRDVLDPADVKWEAAASDDGIERALASLSPGHERARLTLAHGALRAIDLLSHRLAAAGEDPWLHGFDPPSADAESPFLAQAEQVLLATASRRARLGLPTSAPETDATDDHARVLLTQCRDAAERMRRRAPRTGATIRMTYELERIHDLLDRLLLLLDAVHEDPARHRPARVALFRALVRAQADAERVAPLVARGSHLVAAEIVSHAGRTGEHYITRTAREYGGMWLAAGGGGLVVACLACVKVGLAALHAPPLVEAALFSANYALGFMLVQSLGMTIATKQPAMTAAALATSIDAERTRETRPLVETIQCLVRSQLAAIAGNCLVALPSALLLSLLFAHLTGAPVASPEKAQHLLGDLDPLRSLAVPHAALTGVFLALSGIAAGYASNSVLARHVPDRIRRSAPLGRLVGLRGLGRLARLVESSTGVIVGCVVLGLLLGSTGTLGHLLGLPLDIRHVSFSSANLGLALATVGPAGVPLVRVLACIAAIGAANLSVSFGLSLGLALHARRRRLRDLTSLARDLARSGLREPLSWLLPVGASAKPASDGSEEPGSTTKRDEPTARSVAV